MIFAHLTARNDFRAPLRGKLLTVSRWSPTLPPRPLPHLIKVPETLGKTPAAPGPYHLRPHREGYHAVPQGFASNTSHTGTQKLGRQTVRCCLSYSTDTSTDSEDAHQRIPDDARLRSTQGEHITPQGSCSDEPSTWSKFTVIPGTSAGSVHRCS